MVLNFLFLFLFLNYFLRGCSWVVVVVVLAISAQVSFLTKTFFCIFFRNKKVDKCKNLNFF